MNLFSIQHAQRLTTHLFFPALSVLLIAALYAHSVLLTLFLFFITCYLFVKAHSHQRHIIIAAFFVGIGFEVFFTSLGVWSYGYPDAYGITYWIPFAWTIGAWAVSGYL